MRFDLGYYVRQRFDRRDEIIKHNNLGYLKGDYLSIYL